MTLEMVEESEAVPGNSDGGDEGKRVREIKASLIKAQESNQLEWQEIHSKVPCPLYHYTTTVGLTGILDGHCLWASDVRFMNDASELTYAADLIADEVKNVFEAVTDWDAQSLFTGMHTPINVLQYGMLRPFCACMCEEGDLLSQWRGYTAGQIGYSLGFDFGLEYSGTRLPLNMVVRKVIYNADQQRSWVRRIVEAWLRAIAELRGAQPGIEQTEMFRLLVTSALQEALIEQHLCFKNPGFNEEKEWRIIKLIDVTEELNLVSHRRLQERIKGWNEQLKRGGQEPMRMPSYPTRAEDLNIKFRQSTLGFVPYIELPLKREDGLYRDQLPLHSLRQGPTSNATLSMDSLKFFLKSHDISNLVEITQSTIPLR